MSVCGLLSCDGTVYSKALDYLKTRYHCFTRCILLWYMHCGVEDFQTREMHYIQCELLLGLLCAWVGASWGCKVVDHVKDHGVGAVILLVGL